MKTIGTMLCLASLLLLAACTAGPEEAAGTQDAPLPGAAVATCRVVDVQDDQLILAAADGGENDVYALALRDLPVTYEDPSQTEILPGHQIQTRHGGTAAALFTNRKDPPGGGIVKTGDGANPLLYAGLLAACLAGFAGALAWGRRRKGAPPAKK